MKFTKHTIGKGEKAFSVIETKLFNTPIRASKALCDELKKLKPQIDGTVADYDLPENLASRLFITATVKNGYTNLYLTLKKDEPKAGTNQDTEDDLPF